VVDQVECKPWFAPAQAMACTPNIRFNPLAVFNLRGGGAELPFCRQGVTSVYYCIAHFFDEKIFL